MKYRKKPVVIEALEFIGIPDNIDAMRDFVGEDFFFVEAPITGSHYAIKTLEGVMRVSTGDFVIRGVKGEFYPCKPDIFAATYEPEPEEASPRMGLEFSHAVNLLKAGCRVRRSGWNGKGMFVMLSRPEGSYTLESDGKTYGRRPYLYMKDAQDMLVPWLASQTDILAEDWEIV